MIVRHYGTLWAIALLVLLVSLSFSESVKLRKPRKRTTMKSPYQQSRIGPVIIKVMHKYNDDALTRGASGGCTNGNCRNARDKFHLNVNEAISEEDNFLSDEESLRYAVHPQKYEHFVLRKNTGAHVNRYKRNPAFSELHSSNASDRIAVDRDGDRSKENKGNFTRVPLYRIDKNKRDLSALLEVSEISSNETKANLTRVPLYRIDKIKRDLSEHLSEASKVSKHENKGNFTRVPLYRINKNKRHLSKLLGEGEISKNETKTNFTRVPLYRIDKNKRDLSKHLSEASSKTSKNENRGNLIKIPLYRIDDTRDHSKVLSKNENKGNFTRVPLYRISKSKRDLSTFLGEANKVSENENKRNLTRVPLYRIDYNTRDLPKRTSEASRTTSNLNTDYFSRRNDSDYYAQRKAVMDRYYARQREINARYANRTTVTPRLEHNNVSQHRLATSNATLFNLGRVYPSKDSTTRDSVTFRHPPAKIDSIYSNESRYNKIPTNLNSQRNIAPEIGLGFKSDAESQTRSSSNIERNALDYFVTPTPCTNLSSSGTLAPKMRIKHPKNCTGQGTENCNNSTDNANIEGNLRWGRCEGKIVYQHNLLLGLTGPSNLDALFEVIIQGPVCITCVEALRFNETRATVMLDSGGRGHEYAKLKLQGYQNEGFSYIIKVWGINKTGQVCDNVD